MATTNERDPRVNPVAGDVLRDGIGLVHKVLYWECSAFQANIVERVEGTKGGVMTWEQRRLTKMDWALRMRDATVEKRGEG